MKPNLIDREVIVHPVDGMQLSEGFIHGDSRRHYEGRLPGMEPSAGDSLDEVLTCMTSKAKAYYGDDVVVELAPAH